MLSRVNGGGGVLSHLCRRARHLLAGSTQGLSQGRAYQSLSNPIVNTANNGVQRNYTGFDNSWVRNREGAALKFNRSFALVSDGSGEAEIFGVVQIGASQFKVSPQDLIFVEKLSEYQVNDKVVLPNVLLLSSKSQTVVGRPSIPNAEVHAVVEEHVRNAKQLIFKKKRRKGYQRLTGHRQELTGLRITHISGLEGH